MLALALSQGAAAQPLPLRLDTGISQPASAARSPAEALTSSSWPDLVAAARRHAPAGRAAQAAALAAQALSDQAHATAWMPRVDASAATSRAQQTINGLDIRTPTTSTALTASVPLWRAAERAEARAQALQAGQAAWQARAAQNEVAQALSLAFLRAVESAEQRRLALAQQALLDEQLRINERRLQAGAGTILDVLETRTRVDQSRAAVHELTTRINTERLTIERLAGLAVRVPSGLRIGPHALPQVVPNLPEALTLAPLHNPQWRETLAATEAAGAITQARSAERWQPAVDAVATVGRSKQVEQFSGLSDEQSVSSRSIGLQLNWPLYTGGFHDGRTREAAALLTQAQALHDDARAQVEAGLRDAYQTLAQARTVINVQQEVEATAAATYDAVRKAFVAGMRTNLDLLNAQQQIYAARQSLVSARITALAAQVNILALLDRLDADHIVPLTASIDTATP